jgi:hypothetical protein
VSWIKLVEGNDWGFKFYTREGYDRGDRHTGVVWEHLVGRQVRVRWPDGTQTREAVGVESSSCEVSDHGRVSTVPSTFPVLLVSSRGALIRTSLLDVELRAEEWQPSASVAPPARPEPVALKGASEPARVPSQGELFVELAAGELPIPERAWRSAPGTLMLADLHEILGLTAPPAV